MDDRPMTFDDIFRAICQGDCGVILAFSLECLIMAIPFILIGIAVWAS